MRGNLKTIVIYAPVTLPLKSGAGLNAYNLAVELTALGYDLKIITFQYGGLKHKENINGVEVLRIPVKRNNILLKVLSYTAILPVFYYTRLRSNLAIVFGPIQGFTHLLILSKIFRKTIYYRSTMLNVDDVKSINNKYGNLFYPVVKFMLGLMSGYISQTPAMSKYLYEEYGDRIPIIATQGVDISKFCPVDLDKKTKLKNKMNVDIGCDTIVIISVGYVLERKGLREIFNCLAKLSECDFLYIVVGDYSPNENHYLYSSQKEMKSIYQYGMDILGNKILFTGSVENVHEYLQLSDIFVLNSSNEGMPNVLLEAMATGLATIVRHLEGVDGYISIDQKNSIVVNESKSLYSALEELLYSVNERQRLSRNATIHIKENFSLKSVAKRIVSKI